MDVTISVTIRSMASLTKKSNSRFWIACFRDAGGRQRRKSTGVTNERKAREIARIYEQTARRKVPRARFRETLTDLYREVYCVEIPSDTVKQFADDWLETKKAEIRSRSWDTYEKAIKKFLAFLGNDAELDISLLTKAHITTFRNSVAQRVSSTTVNYDLAVIKMMLKAARRDGLIQDDTGEFVNLVKRENAESRRPFTLGDIKAILEVANGEWQSLIKFGLYTGQRLSDLVLLSWANVDLE